jgi:hypothetical protein
VLITALFCSLFLGVSHFPSTFALSETYFLTGGFSCVVSGSQGGDLAYASVPSANSLFIGSKFEGCYDPYFITTSGVQDAITTDDFTAILHLYYGGLGTGSEDIYLYLLDVTQSDTTIMSGEVTPTISTSSTTCDSAAGYAFQISGSTFNIHSGDALELIITNDNTLEDFGVCFGGTTASYITIDPTNVQTVTSTSTFTTTSTATSVSTVISTSIPPPVTTTTTSTVTQTDLSTVTTTEPAVTTTVTSVSTATSTQTIQPTLTIEAKNAMGDPITGQSITVSGPGITSPVTTDGSGEYEFSSGLTAGASYTASTIIDDVTLSGTVTLGGNSVILLEPTAPSIPTPEFPVGALSILIPLLALAAFFAVAIRIRPRSIKRELWDSYV